MKMNSTVKDLRPREVTFVTYQPPVDATQASALVDSMTEGCQTRVVIIDCLQLCIDIDAGDDLSDVLCRFKETAKKQSAHVLVLNQLYAENAGNKSVIFHHRQIVEVEPLADHIWSIRRDEESFVVEVVKSRNGLIGEYRFTID